MSTLQHKQVKSQKQHLKILGAEGRGPRTDIWGQGPRAEKSKYPSLNLVAGLKALGIENYSKQIISLSKAPVLLISTW